MWLGQSRPGPPAPATGVLAVGRPDGLYLAAADGSNPRRVRDDGPYFQPRWSADGTLLAVTALTRVDANDLVILRSDGRFVADLRGVSDFRWSPTGDTLVVGRVVRRTLALVSLADGSLHDLKLPVDVDVVGSFDWSPDGRSIVVGIAGKAVDRNGALWAVDVAGGPAVRFSEERPAALPAWSPDGSRLAAFVSRCPDVWCEADLRLLDPHSGQRRAEIQRVREGADLAWSPDGRWLAFDALVTGMREVLVFDVESLTVTQLTSGPESERVVGWTPDGRAILVSRQGTSSTGGAMSILAVARDGSRTSVLADDAYGAALQPALRRR